MDKDAAHLFVDDEGIAHREGVARVAHACRKLEGPVLTAEAPWEACEDDRRVYVYGTVLREEGAGLRMWYMGYPDRLLVATSEDGIGWRRPELGLVEFRGSSRNNLLPIRLHSPSIVRDAREADPARRYKMLGCDKAGSLGPEGKKGYCAAYSSDGLDWRPYEKNPVLDGSDTCTLAQDPRSGEFLAFHKLTRESRGERRRLVYLSVSRDMQAWSEPVLALAPDVIDDRQTQSEGGRFSQFYNLSAFPYGGQWLGLVTHFRYSGEPKEKGPRQSNQDGPIDVQLVHSRDGRAWRRCEDRSPVIPTGPHAYDAGCILGVANGPVFAGDEAWVYYTAVTTTHGGPLPQKRISIARAAWRRDGWVSLKAGAAGGVVETIAFRPKGGRLTVNAAAADGRVCVEVLDANGRPLEGYAAADCQPLRSDGVRLEVRWKCHDRLPADRALRLRFHLQDADLYAFRLDAGVE